MGEAATNLACPSCKTKLPAGALDCPQCGHIIALRGATEDRVIGVTVGNLVMVKKLGAGGMGAVYRAEHKSLKTPYAVKILHQRFSNNAETVERFRREALACSKLRHENVVFVTDFGLQDDLGIYIVMEFLEGDSLKDVFRRTGRIPAGRLGRFAEQICDAMAAAHRLDIVHRDLKPDNIVVLNDPIRRDFVKVVDFGIAHIATPEEKTESLTTQGLTMGTPTYISPEQVLGKGNIGPQADIYSLGVIFFELLSGAPPFQKGVAEFELMMHHVQTPAPLISTRYPALKGTKIEALIASMLEKKPEKRPGSMQEVKARLFEGIRELQEKGDPDAFYEGASMEMSLPAASEVPAADDHQTAPSIQVTTLIRRIKMDAPDSPAAALLNALPKAESLKGEAIALALWGVLQNELLDAPVDSERFGVAARHLNLLMEAVLFSQGGSKANESQEKIFRSLRNLMSLAQKERQAKLIEALDSVSSHPLFPEDILGKGDKKGGWSALRSAMQKEIKIPWSSGQPSPRAAVPARPTAAAMARDSGAMTDPAFRKLYDKGTSYFQSEKFEDAIREFKAALILRSHPPVLYQIAGAYRLLGDHKEAIEHYEKYLQADPNLKPEVVARVEGFIADCKAQLSGGGPTPAQKQEAARQEAARKAAPAVKDAVLEISLEGEKSTVGPAGPFPSGFGSELELSLELESGPPKERGPAQPAAAPPAAPPRMTSPPSIVSPPAAAPVAVSPPAAAPVAVSPPAAAPVAVSPPAVNPPPSAPATKEEAYQLHYQRAASLCQTERYEEAIAEFAEAYNIDPQPVALFQIAWIYRTIGSPQKALRYFELYRQASPNLRPEAAAKLRTFIAEAREQIEQAAAQVEQAAEAAPTRSDQGNAPPPRQQVIMLTEEARDRAAPAAPPPAAAPAAPPPAAAPAAPPPAAAPPARASSSPTREEPAQRKAATGSYAAHHEKAVGLYRAKRYEEAIKEFEAAYQINPYPALLFNIGGAYRALGRFQEALDHFERYRQLDPDLNPEVLNKLKALISEARSKLQAQGPRG